jgi:Glycosyltransferase family 87
MTTRTCVALVLWIAALAAAANLLGKPLATLADYHDFIPYYVQSMAMREGIDPYKENFESVYTEAGRPLGDLQMGTNHLGDTPTWTLSFEPLTYLSLKTAYWTWQTLNILALAGALFLLIRELGPPGVDGWPVAALMALYPPVWLSISFGRGEMILLLLFVLALIAMKQRRNAMLGLTLGIAALLRAYPLGMLGYLIARRNWSACAYMVGGCLAGGALTLAILGIGPISSFASMTTLLPGKPALGQLMGLLNHPSNLNLGWFVRFMVQHSFGAHAWAPAAGLGVELIVAAISFAVVVPLRSDPYGCGFSLWIALITLLSPVAWPHFLACLLPVYVGVAAAAKEGAAPRRAVCAAGASYLAAFFMCGPTVSFITEGLHRLLAGHVHVWHMVPETIFASLALAYVSALLMAASEANFVRSDYRQAGDEPALERAAL